MHEDAARRSLKLLKAGEGRSFYAVGGTWRSLARLHMAQTGYPLHVMHGYVIRAKEALEFSRLVRRVNPETLSQIDVVRRPAARCCLMRRLCSSISCAVAKPRDVVFSALGVREGLLVFAARRRGAAQGCADRGRAGTQSAALALAAARRGADRAGPTAFMASSGIDESAEEKRLAPRRVPAGRHRLARASRLSRRAVAQHHRACGASSAIDHPGRAFIALAVFFRHVGLLHVEELSPRIRELASTRTLDRARVLGAALRVAYLVSASMPGVLPRAPLKVERHQPGAAAAKATARRSPASGSRRGSRTWRGWSAASRSSSARKRS